MHELRNIAENIDRERCEHSDVHPLAHTWLAADVQCCEVAEAFPESVANIQNLGKPNASEDVQPSMEPHFANDANDSPSVHGDVHVGPVFHIPMT